MQNFKQTYHENFHTRPFKICFHHSNNQSDEVLNTFTSKQSEETIAKVNQQFQHTSQQKFRKTLHTSHESQSLKQEQPDNSHTPTVASRRTSGRHALQVWPAPIYTTVKHKSPKQSPKQLPKIITTWKVNKGHNCRNSTTVTITGTSLKAVS